MSRDLYRVRVINGVPYLCQDIGCEDFGRAEWNRMMVASKLFIKGYLEIEAVVERTPLDKPLPHWITTGELPTVSKEALRQLGGGQIEDADRELLRMVG